MIYICREQLAAVYTNIPDLKEEVAHVLEFYAIYYLLDGNKSVTCGAMRGLSRQGIATWVSGISYYVISLPWQYLFGFYLGHGVTGLWQGQMCAAAFHLGALCYLVYVRFDWVQIGQEAFERVEKEKKAITEQNEMACLIN